jgi:hypothetical protein
MVDQWDELNERVHNAPVIAEGTLSRLQVINDQIIMTLRDISGTKRHLVIDTKDLNMVHYFEVRDASFLPRKD